MSERNRHPHGAIDYLQGELILKTYDALNSKNTIDYLHYLLEESPNQRLLIFGDGASYHRSQEISNFLDEVNQGLSTNQWKIHRGTFCSQLSSTKSPYRIFGCKPKLGFDAKSAGGILPPASFEFLRFDSFILSFKMDVFMVYPTHHL